MGQIAPKFKIGDLVRLNIDSIHYPFTINDNLIIDEVNIFSTYVYSCRHAIRGMVRWYIDENDLVLISDAPAEINNHIAPILDI